jgi:hypothetical protein
MKYLVIIFAILVCSCSNQKQINNVTERNRNEAHFRSLMEENNQLKTDLLWQKFKYDVLANDYEALKRDYMRKEAGVWVEWNQHKTISGNLVK